jgi:hypothetical protein
MNKLEKNKESLEMLRRIHPFPRKCRKEIGRISLSKLSAKCNGSKRVSSNWGKQECVEEVGKNNNEVKKKVVILKMPSLNQHRKSGLFLEDPDEDSVVPLDEQIHLHKEENEIKGWFHPFYLFITIKGIIRVN